MYHSASSGFLNKYKNIHYIDNPKGLIFDRSTFFLFASLFISDRVKKEKNNNSILSKAFDTEDGTKEK